MIRHAGINDFDRIIQLMENFANAAPLETYHQPKYNLRAVQNYLTSLLQGGFILVGEINGEIQGVLLAQICSDPWLAQVSMLRDVAWWVEPGYRHTSMGYRLLKRYTDIGKSLVKNNIVDHVVLTSMVNSPDIDLAKRGWKPIETNYVYEGVA
jgi:N-acetylglutamate synthase-like GNAT family acetyltransferase